MWSNMTTNAFAQHIGLARAENLYQIKRGHYGISQRIATLVTDKFHEINRAWLLTGEGEMFNGNLLRSVSVPFYDEDVCRAVSVVGELRAVSHVVVPAMSQSDFAMRHDGESDARQMTIVLLRRCEGEEPAAGEFVTVNNGVGKIVTTDDGCGVTDAVCEVVGRLIIKDKMCRA